MIGHRPFSELTKDFTEERWQHVATKRAEHPADPLDVPSRLREFRAMQDGWYDGKGVAPRTEGLDWFATEFTRHYPDDIPLPYTCPTPEGGIEMEWSIGDQSVILEVDLSTHQGDYLWFDDKSDVENTRTLDLDSVDSWRWITDSIRQLSEPKGGTRRTACRGGETSGTL